jgi:phosphate starvation-inducible membrane PsiE
LGRRRAQLHLPLRDAVVLGSAAILLLLITDWVFGGVAELVSGALVVVVFLIVMRAAAVRGGRRP